MNRTVLELDAHGRARWTERQDDGRWGEVHDADLDQLGRQIGDRPVDVLVPSDSVLITEVTIAARQQRRLLQALPFAVEDQLAGDVGDYHVALGEPLGDDRYLVAAVARDRMLAWTLALHDAGVEARSLVPSVMALPLEEDRATLLVHGEDALLRTTRTRGYALAIDEVDAYLALEAGLSALNVVDPAGRWTAEADDVEVHQVPFDGHPLTLLAGGLEDQPAVNLLQGEFQTRGQVMNRAIGLWRWAAALAMVAVLMATARHGIEVQRLDGQLQSLRDESAALLQATFPEVGRVVDARAQMAQQLQVLQSASGAGSSGDFLYLLRTAGPTLVRAQQLEIRSASYRDGTLVVDVHAPDLATIERVRQQLLGTLEVELESASTLADGADARLRLIGRAG